MMERGDPLARRNNFFGVFAAAICCLALAAPPARSERPPALQRASSRWVDSGVTHRVDGLRYSKGKSRVLSAASVSYTPGCSDDACISASVTKRVPLRNLTIDASLTAAQLSFGLGGSRYRFEWSGEGEHRTDTSDERAQVERDGSVTGEIDGQTSVEPSEAAAFLQESATSDEEDVMPLPMPRAPVPGVGAGTTSCWSSNSEERRFARLMSGERQAKGLNGLKLDPEVSLAARKHSQEMVDKDLLHHTPPSKLAARITQWTKLGENVGVGDGVDALHEAFMASKVHRDNIMKKAFRFVGVGVVRSDGELWVTVIFEARKNPGTSMSMPSC